MRYQKGCSVFLIPVSIILGAYLVGVVSDYVTNNPNNVFAKFSSKVIVTESESLVEQEEKRENIERAQTGNF